MVAGDGGVFSVCGVSVCDPLDNTQSVVALVKTLMH